MTAWGSVGGAVEAMRPTLDMIERVGPSHANVVIAGEHGTGKEVAARWLHAVSDRAEYALTTVNAGGFSEGIFESEMCGPVQDAFTDAKTDWVGCFELADQGTLFLDEIANVSLQQQTKFLRVIEPGEIQRVGSTSVHRVGFAHHVRHQRPGQRTKKPKTSTRRQFRGTWLEELASARDVVNDRRAARNRSHQEGQRFIRSGRVRVRRMTYGDHAQDGSAWQRPASARSDLDAAAIRQGCNMATPSAEQSRECDILGVH